MNWKRLIFFLLIAVMNCGLALMYFMTARLLIGTCWLGGAALWIIGGVLQARTPGSALVNLEVMAVLLGVVAGGFSGFALLNLMRGHAGLGLLCLAVALGVMLGCLSLIRRMTRNRAGNIAR